MAILSFFIVLLLVAFPLGSFSRVTLGLTVSFSLLDVVVALGSAAWLINKIRLKQKPESLLASIRRSGQSKAFIGIIGVFILSLLINVPHLSLMQLLPSALYIVRFASYGILFFMVAESSAALKQKIHFLLLGGGVLLLLGGYMQLFLFPSLKGLTYFGWDEHFYRMFGTFLDPNFFGLFLALFFLYTIAQLFRMKIQEKKWTFALYFVVSTAIFVAIFLTYSRTALLALFCGICILFWNKYFWKWILIFLAAGIVTALLAFPVLPKHALGNNLFRTNSTDARIGSAKNALTIFMDSPILGVGFNAYRYSVYRHHFLPGSQIQEDHGASGADSSLLLVLATSGVIGLGVYLFFLFSHTRALAASKKKEGLAVLVALVVGSFFVNGLFYPSLLVWLWIVLGLTESA